MSPNLGCYGNDLVNTPNIDRLAAQGMMFSNVFTTGPACSPSRTALATGVYQTTLGAFHMRYSDELKPPLPEAIKILPQLLRDQCYTTGNIRDICHTGSGKDDWLFQTSGKIWETYDWDTLIKQQPFFGQINLSESHRPFARNAKTPVASEKITPPPYYPNHLVTRQDWAGYLEEINKADEHVGAILQKLQDDGLAENTIVCFFSDHGRPMIRGKNWLYDSGTQIPLVIYFPKDINKPDGFRVGSVNSELISTVDLVAETVRWTGGTIPNWMQGRSFLQKNATPRDAVYTAVDRIGNINSCSRAVRTRRFKYIRNFKRPASINECSTAYRRAMHPLYHLLDIMGEKNLLTPVQAQLLQPLATEELYDLEKDPYETVNLIGNPAFKSQHQYLKNKLTAWIKSSGDRGFEAENPAIIEYFTNYGRTTTKDLKMYGATTTPKLQAEYHRQRSRVKAYFDETMH